MASNCWSNPRRPVRAAAILLGSTIAVASDWFGGTAMATVRAGNRSVLLVVDVQAGVVSDAWDAPRIIQNVAHAVERARALEVPVIWVQHSDNGLPQGSPEWQWVPELKP